MSAISVIIPIYNTENHLAYCLDSILAQTFTDFEVLCINDGSTDSSTQILEKYALFDSRIKIFNQENKGVSAARNTGLENAMGKYVIFVDSDDWVSPVMFERFYNNAEKNNSDFVYCNVLYFNEKTQELSGNQEVAMQNFESDFEGKTFNEGMLSVDFFCAIPVNGSVWNKIYKKDFLVSNEIFFPQGLIFEGNPFFAQVYLKAKTISFEKDFLYFHRIEVANTILKHNPEKYFDCFPILEIINLIFQKENKWEKYKTFLLLFHIKALLWNFRLVHAEQKEKFLDEIKKRYTDVRIDQLDMDSLEKSKDFHEFISLLNSKADR